MTELLIEWRTWLTTTPSGLFGLVSAVVLAVGCLFHE